MSEQKDLTASQAITIAGLVVRVIEAITSLIRKRKGNADTDADADADKSKVCWQQNPPVCLARAEEGKD